MSLRSKPLEPLFVAAFVDAPLAEGLGAQVGLGLACLYNPAP
jgi:hypothetical protein